MKLHVTTDQDECRMVLKTLGILEQFKPATPGRIADAMTRIDDDCWLVATNKQGTYTLHMLEGATEAEAWKEFDRIREGQPALNFRAAFVEADGTQCHHEHN